MIDGAKQNNSLNSHDISTTCRTLSPSDTSTCSEHTDTLGCGRYRNVTPLLECSRRKETITTSGSNLGQTPVKELRTRWCTILDRPLYHPHIHTNSLPERRFHSPSCDLETRTLSPPVQGAAQCACRRGLSDATERTRGPTACCA